MVDQFPDFGNCTENSSQYVTAELVGGLKYKKDQSTCETASTMM